MNDNPRLRVFLDANVLAKPVTRSLVLFAAQASEYTATWSAYAEKEADRHLRPGQMPVSAVRQTARLELSPSGNAPDSIDTSPTDRQILADALEAGAQFIITEDVDDFGIEDLLQQESQRSTPTYSSPRESQMMLTSTPFTECPRP